MSDTDVSLASASAHRKLAKDAAAIFATVVVARGVGLLGQAWAAKCLGPTFLGISGVVQSFAQQTSLLCGLGLDNVASRAIARDPASATAVTKSVVRLRIGVASVVAVVWFIAALIFAPPAVRFAWLLGSLIVFGGALSLLFVFQGMEQLPLYNIATMSGAIATAAVIFIFFRPGIGVGMDLAATVIGTAVTLAFAWMLYRRLGQSWGPSETAPVAVRPLLIQSSRYLAQIVFVFFYSQYQVPLIAWRLGSREAGVFRSAFLLATGLELAFNSVTSLMLPRLVKWRAEGVDVFRRRQDGLAWRFAVIGIVAAIAASLIAPTIFQRLLGPEYGSGVPPFRVLVLGRVVVFAAQVYMFGLTALGRDDAFLGATVAGCVASITINALVVDRFGIIGVAWASVCAESVIGLVSWRVCKRALRHPTPTTNIPGVE